jgi:DNA-directed RNA polymerase subunit E'/Rpb7
VLENAKVRVRIERENMKNTKKDEKNCKKTGESEYLSRSLSETRKSVSS